MSQENVEIVRREYVAIAAEDSAALEDMGRPGHRIRRRYGAGRRGLDRVIEVVDSMARWTREFEVEMSDFGSRGYVWPWNVSRVAA